MNREFSLVSIACGLFHCEPGNTDANTEAMADLLRKACSGSHPADVLLFPELAITGYTCADLFLQTAFIRRAEAALEKLLKIQASAAPGIIVCAGLPVLQKDRLFNAAAFLQDGHLLGVVPKTYLPNSCEFYEKRWFAPGAFRSGDNITLCGQTVPFTPDLLVETPSGITIACEICEDLWAPLQPSSRHALMGANIILNPSASNDVATKRAWRRDLVRMQSGRLICAYAYQSSGPGESTTDLVFGGHGIVAVNGQIAAENMGEEGLLSCTVDLERLRNERLRDTSCTQAMPEGRDAYVRVQAADPMETGILPAYVDSMPFVPSAAGTRAERCQEILHLQASGLAQRMRATGLHKLVIGISGGLDSTLALLVACQACDMLHEKRTMIHGITMPGFGTTDHTLHNACTLMERLGVRQDTISIASACRQHFEDIGQPEGCYDVTYENAQARERTQILMDLANKENALVVGTGDMSELALGWATYNGDHMSMYAVNAGVPKTLVRFLVEEYGAQHTEVQDVLEPVCATEISPELLPPDAAGQRQSTEKTIGRYVLHDFFLYNFVRCGFSRKKIQALAGVAFPGEEEAVDKTLAVFFRRFFSQQYKRSCLPDGPKVGTVSLSPRGDWRMPSDCTGAEWQ